MATELGRMNFPDNLLSAISDNLLFAISTLHLTQITADKRELAKLVEPMRGQEVEVQQLKRVAVLVSGR